MLLILCIMQVICCPVMLICAEDPCCRSALEGCTYQHPFAGRVSPVVFGGSYVTAESGTGLVHTAPGHGQEDYQVTMLAMYHSTRVPMNRLLFSSFRPRLSENSLTAPVCMLLGCAGVRWPTTSPDSNNVARGGSPSVLEGITTLTCTWATGAPRLSGVSTPCWQVGQRCGLPLLSPVDDAGLFTDEAGAEFAGLAVLAEGNEAVIAKLRDVGALLKARLHARHHAASLRASNFLANSRWCTLQRFDPFGL